MAKIYNPNLTRVEAVQWKGYNIEEINTILNPSEYVYDEMTSTLRFSETGEVLPIYSFVYTFYPRDTICYLEEDDFKKLYREY